MHCRVPVSKESVCFPGTAMMEQVLRAYLDREAAWFWLLTQGKGTRVYGVMEEGVMRGVHFERQLGLAGGLPDF